MILDGKDFLIGLGTRTPVVPEGEEPWNPFALALGSNGAWSVGASIAEVLNKVAPQGNMARVEHIKLWVGFVMAQDLTGIHAIGGDIVIPRDSVYHVMVFKKGKAVQL